jgi:hypothetical protein
MNVVLFGLRSADAATCVLACEAPYDDTVALVLELDGTLAAAEIDFGFVLTAHGASRSAGSMIVHTDTGLRSVVHANATPHPAQASTSLS